MVSLVRSNEWPEMSSAGNLVSTRGQFPRLGGVDKGAIEQITTVTTASNKDTSSHGDIEYTHERFRNHTDKHMPSCGTPVANFQ